MCLPHETVWFLNVCPARSLARRGNWRTTSRTRAPWISFISSSLLWGWYVTNIHYPFSETLSVLSYVISKVLWVFLHCSRGVFKVYFHLLCYKRSYMSYLHTYRLLWIIIYHLSCMFSVLNVCCDASSLCYTGMDRIFYTERLVEAAGFIPSYVNQKVHQLQMNSVPVCSHCKK